MIDLEAIRKFLDEFEANEWAPHYSSLTDANDVDVLYQHASALLAEVERLRQESEACDCGWRPASNLIGWEYALCEQHQRGDT